MQLSFQIGGIQNAQISAEVFQCSVEDRGFQSFYIFLHLEECRVRSLLCNQQTFVLCSQTVYLFPQTGNNFILIGSRDHYESKRLIGLIELHIVIDVFRTCKFVVFLFNGSYPVLVCTFQQIDRGNTLLIGLYVSRHIVNPHFYVL